VKHLNTRDPGFEADFAALLDEARETTAAVGGAVAEIIAAIRDGRRPEGMSADEEMVYDVSIELHRN